MRRLAGGLAALVLAALPAAVLAFTSNPNDPYYTAGYQWALSGNASSTNAPQAWCVSTGSGIVIADIDTGVDLNHPDLRGGVIAGANFTSGAASTDPSQDQVPDNLPVLDDYGHGTMTTGIMVARTNNGYGMAAEAPTAQALVMKVFSNQGPPNGYSANDTDISAAMIWAVKHGARVINLSLGGDLPSNSLIAGLRGDTVPATIKWAAANNIGVAIAAGNGAFDSGVAPPAGSYTDLDPYALVVGAMGPSGHIASYSQNGVGVNIYAPGGDGSGGDPHADILSTYPTYTPGNSGMPRNVSNAPYALYDGTSFSAPYTAGTLALLMARGLSAAQARSRIIATAKSVGGFPVVDARAALGACPAGGGGGGGGGCCSGSPGATGSTGPASPAGTKPATSPAAPGSSPSASAGPGPAAGPGGSGAGPATIHTQSVTQAPRALVLVLTGLGVLALLAAGVALSIRTRLFTHR